MEFLEDYEHVIGWTVDKKAPGALEPEFIFIGSGDHGLEVALAKAASRPRVEDVRKLWKARHAGRPSPVLLVVTHDSKAAICGPVGDNPPVISDLGVDQVERLCSAALAEHNRHSAVRFLVAMMDGLHTTELLPGVRNMGMLATHEMRSGVPARADWDASCKRGKKLLSLKGRQLVEGLGFGVETLSTTSSVLTIDGSKRVVAVFLDEGEGFEDPASRFNGISPVSNALALADRENLPWVVLTRGRQIRLYSARPDIGVGRKGRAETFVELNLALLPEEAAGFLSLLFSPEALTEGGSFEQILETSADHAAALGQRLRERVYFEAVPNLAEAVVQRLGEGSDLTEEDLQFAYEQTLVILFRLLFVAYAEDKDLLPYRTNSRYEHHALKRLARDLAERFASSDHLEFDDEATDLWNQVRSLWRAVDKGNADWGVPVYDGGLFSDDPEINPPSKGLAELELTNAEIGPALFALLVNRSEDDAIGPVDFRSLSVREFGTIYEGLLESRLSVAPSDLTVDPRGNYVPATKKSEAIHVEEGHVYFHNRSGSRKSTGSYFTKPFAVENLLNKALEPALEDHVNGLVALFEAGDEAALVEAFFDFRCADLAMGSGHFLVAAVDRIEAKLSAFLALHPVAPINAELERLRSAALNALGDLADGIEIEHTSLLRRQVARRCIYGIDLNSIAVELARLAVWIHTFVPGLPLSFLDHNLVEGNSLTGVATLDEALGVLDPATDTKLGGSLIGGQIEAFLNEAETLLHRVARISETTKAEVDATREAWEEAAEAIEPARQLFDLVVAARLGEIDPPVEITEEAISNHPKLGLAEELAEELQALHLPIAFPEVFLRERPGFDCILGNPPWEKLHVDEREFWSLRYPGLRSLSVGELNKKIRKLRKTRPDLVAEYEASVQTSDLMRETLLRGPYEDLGSGHPDLYKAFCWRFWQLVRQEGTLGVVLPRAALSAAGSTSWRNAILDGGIFSDVTFLTNTGGWVFDDAEPRYTIALVAIRKTTDPSGQIHLGGPFASYSKFFTALRSLSGIAHIAPNDLRSWSETATFPMFPDADSINTFLKMRAHPSLGKGSAGWRVRLVQGDLNATTGKEHMELSPPTPEGLWPVYKGASFNIWTPDTGQYYAFADPDYITKVMQEKRLGQAARSRSAFSEFPSAWINDTKKLPCLNPRIAYRRIARATDSRTIIACLVPPNVLLTDKAAYILWPQGDERDEAYLLGILSSIPFDWYARRIVEIQVDFHVLLSFPIPAVERDNPLRRQLEMVAGSLAAVDKRFNRWANQVGVGVAGVGSEEVDGLVAEVDAITAVLYGLDRIDLRNVFATFHLGWDYSSRLKRTLDAYDQLQLEEAST